MKQYTIQSCEVDKRKKGVNYHSVKMTWIRVKSQVTKEKERRDPVSP